MAHLHALSQLFTQSPVKPSMMPEGPKISRIDERVHLRAEASECKVVLGHAVDKGVAFRRSGRTPHGEIYWRVDRDSISKAVPEPSQAIKDVGACAHVEGWRHRIKCAKNMNWRLQSD